MSTPKGYNSERMAFRPTLRRAVFFTGVPDISAFATFGQSSHFSQALIATLDNPELSASDKPINTSNLVTQLERHLEMMGSELGIRQKTEVQHDGSFDLHFPSLITGRSKSGTPFADENVSSLETATRNRL